ncbi:unnamed protein product [Coregonus sp. 'balchen']|nr:unnamed protein product [Coregonus sp. 'balchen']
MSCLQMSPEDYREHSYVCRPEEHTLETALLSASQEIEMGADNPAAVHSVIQQRDVLQSGLLSTCRELSRVNTELERSWREYEKMEGDVSLAKNNLLDQLEALGSPQGERKKERGRGKGGGEGERKGRKERGEREKEEKKSKKRRKKKKEREREKKEGRRKGKKGEGRKERTEPPSQQHVHIQKELWRIQDVMEALNKNKAQRHADTQGYYGSTPISNKHKSEEEVEDLSAPPRPPLPQAYEPNPPAVPPLPSRVTSSGRPPPPRGPEDRDRKAGQRNGTHSRLISSLLLSYLKVLTSLSSHHGPDYRLYKSEPELTTVTEVDETNGEDRSEQSDRDPANTKGMSYPVGIVPPRTKSPNMPESSSITSYVTLRRGGRPDPRMERPHSAVEQLCGGAVEKESGRRRMSERPHSVVEQLCGGAVEKESGRRRMSERPHSAVEQLCGGAVEKESGRPRMSVEEQLERIRRHQQGALREKKKGLHILAGSSCNSQQDNATHSHSTASTPSRSPSFTKENPFRSMQNRRQRGEVMSSDILELEASLREQEVEALSPEQEADKQKKVDRIKALIAKNSMQNVLSPPGPEKEDEEEATAQDQEKMINISYELAAEASKRSKLVAALASVKTYT